MNCKSCGGFVTPDFARVFGTEDNKVHRCPSCADMTEIKQGGGATEPPSDARIGR